MKNNTKGSKAFIDRIMSLKISRNFNEVLVNTRVKIEKSIRFELMMVIGMCFLLAFVFYSFTNNHLKKEYTEPQITYDYDSIERAASDLARRIESEENLTLNDNIEINRILNDVSSSDKSYITDLDGKVLYKTPNVIEENIDIYSALKDAMTNVDYEKSGNIKEKKYIMPLKIGGKNIFNIFQNSRSKDNIQYSSCIKFITSNIAYIDSIYC